MSSLKDDWKKVQDCNREAAEIKRKMEEEERRERQRQATESAKNLAGQIGSLFKK